MADTAAHLFFGYECEEVREVRKLKLLHHF